MPGTRVVIWFGDNAGDTGTVEGRSEGGRAIQVKLDRGGYALIHRAYIEPMTEMAVARLP